MSQQGCLLLIVEKEVVVGIKCRLSDNGTGLGPVWGLRLAENRRHERTQVKTGKSIVGIPMPQNLLLDLQPLLFTNKPQSPKPTSAQLQERRFAVGSVCRGVWFLKG